jgi:hypothetical protein
VVNIHIPPVRELPAEQLKARLVAMTTWNTAYSQLGDAALAKPPADVSRALAALEESSGDEESGDEYYRALHRVMEEEEARRLSGFAGTGAQRGRNQNKAQPGDGKDGGVAGPPEKRGAPEKRGVPEKRSSGGGGAPPKPPSKAPLKSAGWGVAAAQAAAAAAEPPTPTPTQAQQQSAVQPQEQQQQQQLHQAQEGGDGQAVAAVPEPAASDGMSPGGPFGGQATTPTVVKRATASGPAAAALKRAGSGSLSTRSSQQLQDQQQQAPQQAQQPDPQGRATRQQAQPQKATSARPARTPR